MAYIKYYWAVVSSVKNRRCESHSLLMGVNKFLSIFSTLTVWFVWKSA